MSPGNDEQEDFAAMFEASVKARRFERGQTIEGVIVGFGPKVAFVDVGGKGEAEIDIEELKDADGDVEVSVGDRLTAVVVGTSGGIVLSRKGVRNAATQREIEDAFRVGLAVEGKVEKAVKGGYEVRIARERAFCPLSQIDIARTTDAAAHEGKHYTFRVIEYKNGGKDIVLSRRKHLEEEQRASAEAVRKSIVPGAIVSGRVASVLDFGAFVDLGGGIQGLLHVSEMSWSRNTTPGAIVAPGDQITVKVLRVDEATGKISLGLKQLQDDPWATVPARFEVGQVRNGRVTRIAEFGAFVELEPGIEGLAHASTFPPTSRPGGWATSINVGMTGAFEILSIDTAQKRIGVALLEEGSARAAGVSAVPVDQKTAALAPGAIVAGKVERHEKFGVFVFLSPGRTGLIPLSETGLDRDADVAKAFPIGSEIEVVVLEVDPASRRIRLSRKAV
ncbi:MAG TPA: S1 RNA-binding domain-containing protein, partial [Vicinamibacterales bacterium]|nr:S1 RNA-binding domain-containing protein [Vicinamibacterales bacterium]